MADKSTNNTDPTIKGHYDALLGIAQSRKELNEDAALQREKLVELGIPKSAQAYNLKLMKLEAEDRDNHDRGVKASREATGIPIGDLFD